ncbi:MAG TPA: hypothetical protein VGI03_00235 [Verrucomicrobiae bacterium]|jgi:hypothetical protein
MAHDTRLTTEQATSTAMQLANDKATTLYHCQPFQETNPAHFVDGRWIWIASDGKGLEVFRARVVLAADGSTNSTNIKLLNY